MRITSGRSYPRSLTTSRKERSRDRRFMRVFSTDGQQWKDYRRLFRMQFSKHRVADFDILEKHMQTFLSLLSGSTTVDIGDLFARLGMDTMTEAFFDQSSDSLTVPNNALAHAFDEVQRIQNLIFKTGPLKVFFNKRPYYDGIKTIDAFVQPLIKRTLDLQDKQRSSPSPADSTSFLHNLASYTSDPKVIRDQLVSALMAGRDTTGSTLSWMYHELSKQPHLVARLRAEILSKIGHDRPSIDDLKSLRLLQHTINETMRVHPGLPFATRIAARDTTLPRGGGPDGTHPIGVLKGTVVCYSNLIMFRRPDIYPSACADFPDYRDFAPDRWEKWSPRSWTFIPFNAGPRVCVGQEFAMAHMAYVTVRILQSYERIECVMRDEPGERCDVILFPGKSIEVLRDVQ
ncbi:hypothetical protein ANO11243_092440 [Dothideomycetidae sp. 11243]|nr:hypothetical protein ANO11243_092440 [fungal sp. No.11243]